MTAAEERSDPGQRGQSRRRGAELRRAIFQAVLGQLSSVGYARLSMEGVATAAGTGKAALYRRWGGKEELVRDVLGDLLPEPPEIPADTSLRDGLLRLLSYFNAALSDSRGAPFQAVAAETGSDSTMLRELFRTRVTVPCQERILALVRRDAGPLDPTDGGGEAGAEAEALIAAVGPAMLLYHCLNGQDRSTDRQIASVVDSLLLPLAYTRPTVVGGPR